MEKIEFVLRREQNNRNGIYLNYVNGYWYTYEWSAFLLCMLFPEIEVRKLFGVQPEESYAIARVKKTIIKKLEKKYPTSVMDDSIKILLPPFNEDENIFLNWKALLRKIDYHSVSLRKALQNRTLDIQILGGKFLFYS